jgi:hypothetical protein
MEQASIKKDNIISRKDDNMTEQTLNKAMQIKKNLDSSRAIRNNIEEKKKLCIGNFSEVASRKFELNITDGTSIKSISISSDTAYEALKIEMCNADKVVCMIEKELEQLN